MAGIAQVLATHSKEVQKLEVGQAQAFLRHLQTTRDVIRGRLAALGDKGDVLDAFRLKSILGEVEANIGVLQRRAMGLWTKADEKAVELSFEHIGQEIDRLSRAFGAEPLIVNLDAARAMSDPVRGLLAQQFEASVQRYGLEVLNQVRGRLIQGVITGDPISHIARDLTSSQGPLGGVGRAKAESIVRTEVSAAYNTAHQSGFKQAKAAMPDATEVWLHVGSYKCPTCGPLHGTKRPESGYWTIRQGQKEKKVERPPAHPRCGCRLLLMRPKWRKGMVKLGYLERQGEEDAATL